MRSTKTASRETPFERGAMSTMPEWLTVAEAAHYLQIKPRTLLYWAHNRQLKGYRLSGVRRHTWRFRKEDLDAALTANDASVVIDSVSPSVAVQPGRIQ